VRHKMNPYENGKLSDVVYDSFNGQINLFFKLILFVTGCTDLLSRLPGPRMSLGHQCYVEHVQQKPNRVSTVGVKFQQKSTRCQL
jgi:hypothetical protein